MSTQAPGAAGRPEDDTSRLTTRLEEVEPPRRGNDDRIRELVAALGDPNHPEHSTAINELVEIGPEAVGALGAALSPDRPWLASYRAAEALAQIGDGRASGALIGALRHPNSNVRWGVVRALAEVGDTRTLWALRRVAAEDRGKTSWGESVSDTAQHALDRLQSRSALLRFSEPVKTALVFVMMFASVLFAIDRVQALTSELRRDVPVPAIVAGGGGDTEEIAAEETAAIVEELAAVTPTPEIIPTPEATPTPSVITSTVRAASGNVRSAPELGNNVVGFVNQGDELIFVGANGDWYLVRLGEKVSERSYIRPGEGWVSRIVVNEPAQPVPPATPGPAPGAAPTGTPQP